ncbi:HlyD family efflux transporter periplasmic adaptor subunit [Leptobacterium flavescens]|uniref:HlyD family efflux transporter periplasmic adaptor subunit n=1 Tax=Leptobacterium flavescens TaxID=472055 RepID=A0A6P0UNJ9_9FLAO|nr:HlyD family efflux transporter periplasmic adaptor subunit [Leptobacterium flavescens]NER12573.1 HlyD family efflux transporter periplasmic adaptor subunit [Leptobacterium flavescens]
MAEEVKKKRKIDELDERSSQVKEILGQAPNWVIRWGITVVFIIIALVFVGAALISYNDILPSRIVITTENPPVYLDAKSSGRMTNVFVEANQLVKENEILAEIENTANFDDIYYLKKKLALKEKVDFFVPDIFDLDSLRSEFPTFLGLGPVQLAYNNFLTEYQNYIQYNLQQPNKRESQAITRQIREQQDQLEKQQNQLENFREQLNLSKNDLDRQEKLFNKGVVSKAEYEDAQRSFLADESQYESLKTTISNTRISIAGNRSALTRSEIQGEESTNNNRQELEKAYQNLSNGILDWERAYILKSPIDGKITIFDVWNKNQNIRTGEILFTIVPNNYEKLVGKLSVPIQNSGKLKLDQRVIIKLDNYPHQEWGSLEGTVVNISDVPKQGEEQAQYTIYVDINSLVTSYEKEIEFRQEMQGAAEIVLEELTVLQRIFYQLRSVLNR